MSGLSETQKYLLLGGLIISGFFNTVAYKFQNTSYVTEKGYPIDEGRRKFFHPYMQAVAMFVGEAICMLLFFGYKKYYKEDYDKQIEEQKALGKKKPNIFLIAMPAFSDACTSTLQHVALVFVSASIYQMMRGGTIAIIAAGSVIFLKRKLFKFQIIGCVIVIGGIVIIGIAALVTGSNNGSSADAQMISIIMLLISLFTAATTALLEEYLLRKYYLHPFQLVGWEGTWGFLIYMLIFMPFLEFMHCGLPDEDCVWSDAGHPYFERVQQYFIEMIQAPLLFIMCILGVFSISIFNVVGVTVTKYISALTRNVVDQVRTILVWVFSIIITTTHCCGIWENTQTLSVLLELAGFVVLMVGQVTYNQIVKWPCYEKEYQQVQSTQELKTIEVDIDLQRAKVMTQSFGEKRDDEQYESLIPDNAEDDQVKDY